jgi:prepilin peptidase CpaA
MLAWTPDSAVLGGLLAIAAVSDVVRHRIPNAVTVAVAATGLASVTLRGGWSGALSSSAGLVVVFGALVVPWRRRAIGGGDLKLAAAAAAWVGLWGLWRYALASALALGAFALLSYLASSEAARREIRANLALAGRGVSVPVEIGAGGGRVPVPAGAAFAVGALGAVIVGG